VANLVLTFADSIIYFRMVVKFASQRLAPSLPPFTTESFSMMEGSSSKTPMIAL
jgi:hypothetical protein